VTGGELVGFSCAALAATGNAVANVMQRKASVEQPPDRKFGLRLLRELVTTPTWLIGFAALVASFVLQAVALGLGPLAAVEPIITLEVPLTLLLASSVFKSRLGRLEWTGIMTMTFGMILLIAILNPQPGNESAVSHATYVAAGGGTVATIAALVAAAQRGSVFWRTVCLGAAAGTSFGLTATMIKETVDKGKADGIVGVLTTWQTYVAVGFGIAGLVLVQWALHTGPLLAAQPGFTLMDPIVSILWGVLVFNEATRTGWALLPATLSAIAVGVGVSIIARSPLFDSTVAPDDNHIAELPTHTASRTADT
jgi:drug/metabolite transporter (DMT)-like permease